MSSRRITGSQVTSHTMWNPHPIPLIKVYPEERKKESSYVEAIICGYPASASSETYEAKLAMFNNSKAEELLLFICDSKKIGATGATYASGWIHYLHTIICREALHEFDILANSTGTTTNGNFEEITKHFGKFFLFNEISKQKCEMRCSI